METAGRRLRIGILCEDLLMGSRVREALRETDCDLISLGGLPALLEQLGGALDLVLVSMNLRRTAPVDAIAACKRHNVRCVAFAGHSEAALHDAARDAGAWTTVANSAVAMALPQWIARWHTQSNGDAE